MAEIINNNSNSAGVRNRKPDLPLISRIPTKIPLFIAGIWLFWLFYNLSILAVSSLAAYQFQHQLSRMEVRDQPVSVPILRSFTMDTAESQALFDEYKSDYAEQYRNYIEIENAYLEFKYKNHPTETDNLNSSKEKCELEKIEREMEWRRDSLHCQLTATGNDLNKAEIEARKIYNKAIIRHGFLNDIEKKNDSDGENVENTVTEDNTENEDNTEAESEANNKGNTKTESETKVEHSIESNNVDKGCDKKSKYVCSVQHIELGQSDLDPLLRLHPKYYDILGVYNYLSPKKHQVKTSNNSLIILISWTLIRPLKIDFVNMPNQMLTMLVVIIIGALGGTISLGRRCLDQIATLRVADFLLVPLLGGVTAFAVYILAKAGVLIIADFGGSGEASINPYFISFIGLVSGMLTLKALKTIEDVGLRWFKGASDGKERYWIGSPSLTTLDNQETPAPKQEEISETRLKQHIEDETGVNIKIIENWLSGKVLVPPYVQRLMAAWMRIPRRELFTDLAPPEAKTDSTHSSITVTN